MEVVEVGRDDVLDEILIDHLPETEMDKSRTGIFKGGDFGSIRSLASISEGPDAFGPTVVRDRSRGADSSSCVSDGVGAVSEEVSELLDLLVQDFFAVQELLDL